MFYHFLFLASGEYRMYSVIIYTRTQYKTWKCHCCIRLSIGFRLQTNHLLFVYSLTSPPLYTLLLFLDNWSLGILCRIQIIQLCYELIIIVHT